MTFANGTKTLASSYLLIPQEVRLDLTTGVSQAPEFLGPAPPSKTNVLALSGKQLPRPKKTLFRRSRPFRVSWSHDHQGERGSGNVQLIAAPAILVERAGRKIEIPIPPACSNSQNFRGIGAGRTAK